MTNAALVAVGMSLAFGLSGALWFRGLITIGTVYLIVDYTGLLFSQVAELRWQLSDLQHADAGIQRIQALFNTRSKLSDGAPDARCRSARSPSRSRASPSPTTTPCPDQATATTGRENRTRRLKQRRTGSSEI